MNPPVPPQAAPVNSGRVELDYPSAVRARDATRYVEGMIKGRGDRGYGGRGSLNPATYAYLDAGTFPGISGSSLGSANVVLCSSDGASLTADGETILCYNAGGSFDGPVYMLILWVDGNWSVGVVKCP
jgi:hypothetical protein